MMSDTQPGIIARTPILVIWVFIFLMAGGFIWNQSRTGSVAARNAEARTMIRDAQIESCERINTLRTAHNRQNAAIRSFMSAAAAARSTASDHEVAQQYLELAGTLSDVQLTDCEAAFPEGIARSGI